MSTEMEAQSVGLLGLLMSPGTMMPKPLVTARREYRESQTAETKAALDRETSRLKERRVFLGGPRGQWQL